MFNKKQDPDLQDGKNIILKASTLNNAISSCKGTEFILYVGRDLYRTAEIITCDMASNKNLIKILPSVRDDFGLYEWELFNKDSSFSSIFKNL